MKRVTPYAIPGIKTDMDEIIAESFETTVEMIHSKTKKRPHSTARQFGMWYCQVYLNQSQRIAGERYGRDHVTALAARNTIWNLMESDRSFNQLANKTVDRIRATKRNENQ